MRNIKLADLFACDESGMMVVAEDRETGQPIHISAAERGLKCDCLCPVCGRTLVARKGSRQHSFAHYPQDVKESCVAAGETLLHRLAKDVLAREKYIIRPAMTARDELGPLELKPAGKVVFDRVELELGQSDIVPDVVCHLGRRRLFVEFRVTHAVDEAKLKKLRDHDASVIEIDLSGYRDHELDQLPLAILETAPRVMLQSEILDRAPRLLARRQEDRMAGLRAMAQPYLRAFVDKEPLMDVSREPWFDDAVRHSVPDLLPEPGFGDEPFRVRPDQWRIWVLWQLLTTKTGWTAKRLAYEMLKSKWVKQGLYDPPENISDFIRTECQPNFRSATETAHEFLKELKTRKLVYAAGGKRFFANGLLMRWFEERCDELSIPNERRDELEKIVGSIVRVLPFNDSRHFDFDEWLETRTTEYKVSVEDLLSPNAGYYYELCDGLNEIRRAMAAFAIKADLDFLGLPLETYFLEKQNKLEARRQCAEEQALLDAIRRADKLDTYVQSFRSPRAHQLLLRRLEYEGRLAIPGEHVSWSPRAAAEMRRLFDEERKQWEDEARFARIREESQAILLSHVTQAYGSAERAALWMNCHLKEIGMRRPIDYCVDETTLTECLAALPFLKRR
ncbi:UNVERIFIED_ORG: hypothetical protein GGI63_005256 [Rhizobium esperanzae]